MRLLQVLASALFLLTAGCGDMDAEFELQRALVAELQTPAVSLTLHNDTLLTVFLPDSLLREAGGEPAGARCRAVAELVRDHYARYAALQRVAVQAGPQRVTGPYATGAGGPGCSLSAADLGPPAAAEGAT